MEECIICFEETNDFIFYICAHKVCSKCYPRIKTCPICNTPRERQLEIVIHRTEVSEIRTTASTYRMMVWIGTCLLIGALGVYFYNINRRI